MVALGASLFVPEPAAPLERLRSGYERRGWALTLWLPLCVAFGALLGIQAAAGREALAAQRQRVREAAQQAREVRARDEAERASEQAAAATDRARRLELALDEQRWLDARGEYEELKRLDPKHPALPAVWATLGPQLEALATREREQSIEAALHDARRMQTDPIVCDDARAVAAAWKAFRALPATDPRRGSAVALVPSLERCRKVVARSLALNAAEQRRQARLRLAPRIEVELRRAGHLVNVTLSGAGDDRLRIAGDALDAKAADALTDLGSRTPASLLGRLQEQGVRSVEIVNGRHDLATIILEPASPEVLAAQLLGTMGLDAPLALPVNATATP
jgi:hypothetical protein